MQKTNTGWVQQEWPKPDVLEVGQLNIINQPLVNRQKIIFPPLRIKLGLMKQFVKAFNKENYCFKYLRESFPNLGQEKLKAGIFHGPQTMEMKKDK